MRNWPPLQSLLVLIALGLLLIPLTSLTGKRNSVPSPVVHSGESSPATAIEAHAILRFAHPPDRFTVLENGSPVWSVESNSGDTEFESDLQLKGDAGFVDLEIAVVWPAGAPQTVVEMEFIPEAYEAVVRTAWGTGEFQSSFTFPLE